uniref:histidine kinase n=1 Tax=Candidatus Desulfatibia profunda TaxID=2841695 RepID=A0A8J6NP47_9BACT|nr:PAS domain S-box protein [Candidatus Desulfatibia profunda]
MAPNPTHEKPEQTDKIKVSGINIEWRPRHGTCTFENLPAAMLWIDTTLAGLMSGVQAMVGTDRFGLALQAEGRNSVEADWQVISRFSSFRDGFIAIANIAAVAGWGNWRLVSFDDQKKECRFQVKESWEGRYQKSLGVCWGSGMLAGKLAGYCSKLFNTNCWADQTAYIAKGDKYDEFTVGPSERSIEKEIENLLATDEATRADMAVALQTLRKEAEERRRTEEALRESEERYRSLFKNNHSVMLLIDPKNADIVDANPAAVCFYGWSHQELTGKKITDINTLTRKQVFQEMERAQTEQRRHFLFCHRLASGEIRDVEVYSGPIKVHGKKLLYSIVHDITSRKQAETALRESENRFRMLYKESKQREQLYESLLKSTPDAVTIYNLKGETIYINPAFTRIFGFTMEDVLGKRIPFVPESEMKRTLAGIEQVLDGIPVYGFETRRLTKDGRILDITLSSACYHDHEGNAGGIVVMLRDVTEAKKTEKQLQQAQRMEAIGTLAGGIAHDFNNLLMGIQGRTSLMLMDTEFSHPFFEHLKGIEDYIKSAADLTRQLLAFARSGKYEVKPTDLNELVHKSAELFGRTKKEISIHKKYRKGIWSVEVDQSQIEQVMLNLYVNAWQSMPGGGELYLETANVVLDDSIVKPYDLAPGNYVKISVADTGVGMDKATLERIFDPFFTTKEMGRGTGLGLASAYGIIKNHGGIINAYSEKGQGAVFSIYLPASEKKVVKEKELPQEILKGDETILLVDDEKIIIDVAKELLKRIGYKVLIAKSGKAAVELYEANTAEIDMVILDMIMPEMGGGETYDRLKKINPDVKVLLSSGYSIDGQATEILKRGCSGFIQKPFRMKDLSHKLREILDSS